MKSSSALLCALTTVPLLLAAAEGHAQPGGTRPPSLPDFNKPPVEPQPESEPPAEVEGVDLQQQIEELRMELRRKEEEQRRNVSRLSVNGYADVGFFAPLGNEGAGWVRDFGNMQFPERDQFAWVFLGDILATTVNTRGEAADLGDAPGIDRFDSINSDGAGGFLVNEVNLRVGYQLAERALLRTSVNFVPRSGRRDFDLGDSTDVDLAELEYVLTDDGNTSFFVGKTLPVFGIEYKERKSDQRFGITPSLIHRYTSGPQLGIKFRTKLSWLILAAALSNNSSVTEQFHFHTEVDKNWGKTASGRAAVPIPMGGEGSALAGDRLELGGSILYGSQDRATNNKGRTFFWGFDLQYLSADFAVKAQMMKGESDGRPMQGVWGLDLSTSGYLEFDWQIVPQFGMLLRGGLRDAEVTLAQDRLYLTKSTRWTAGARVVFNPHMVLKLEYLHNREYGGIDQIDNDIATSSLVLHF
jgi:hypothetical protein